MSRSLQDAERGEEEGREGEGEGRARGDGCGRDGSGGGEGVGGRGGYWSFKNSLAPQCGR